MLHAGCLSLLSPWEGEDSNTATLSDESAMHTCCRKRDCFANEQYDEVAYIFHGTCAATTGNVAVTPGW